MKSTLKLPVACDQGALPSPAKACVARAFSRAAHSYDTNAQVQQHSAAVLLRYFANHCHRLTQPLTLLDLGCGTGFMIPDLLNMAGTQGHVVAADFSDGMLAVAAKRYADRPESRLEFQQLDAEALPFYKATFDGIYSNLMLQWCDLSKVLMGCHQILKPQGIAAFSTLVEGTLTELTTAWSSIDQAQHTNRFLSKPRLMQQAQAAGYQCYFATHTEYYPSVKALLMALKGIGANWVQTAKRRPLTKQTWQGLQQAYDAYRTERGLPVSYQLAYLVRGPSRKRA